MAGLIVGRITAQMGLDDNGFTRGVATAGKSMQTLGSQAKQTEASISAAMKGAVTEVDRYAAKVATAKANQAAAAAKAEKAEKSLIAAQNNGSADKAADAQIRLDQARARLTTSTLATREAVAGLNQANEEAASTSDSASESITNMGDSSETTAGKLAAMAAGALTAGAVFTKVLTTGMDFTTSLNELQAVSGATASQMSKVSDAARALGNDISLPGTSANDAAAAMTELAKGGFSVDKSMQAAKGTLQLAAAAQIEAADAATIQSQALQAFGKDASFASQAADILANTSNASSAEMTDVADALQQAGTVANGFGVSMADTATVLGLFANAGITGSDAGTLLKTSLQSLTDQGKPAQQAIEDLSLTVYDANGNFVGMRSLWEQLSVASKNMTAEQFQASTAILFGSDAMRTAMISAGGGVEAYDKMRDAVGKSGTAAEVAAAKTQGLPGAWERVQNAIESVSLTTYDAVQGPLTSLANSGASIIGVADGMAGGLGMVVAPVSALANAFAAIPGPLQTMLTLMVAAKVASMAFGTQIQSVRNYASNAAGVMRNYGTSITQMQRAATLAGGSMNRMSASIAVLARNNATIASMGASYLRASGQAQNFARTQGVAAAATVGMKGAAGGLMGALGGPWGIAIAAATAGLMFWMNQSQKAKQKTAEQKAAVEELSQAYDVNTGKLNQQGRETVSSKLQAEGILAVVDANKQWGVSIDRYTDAATGQTDAIDQVNAALDKQVTSSAESSANWREHGEEYRTAGVSLAEYTAALRGNEAAQDSVREKMTADGQGVQGSRLAWESLGGQLDRTGQAAIRTGNALGNATDNLDLAKTRAQQLGEANGDITKSMDGTTQAVGPMTEAMVEFGESTDGAASKVDKLAKALDGLDGDKLTEEESLQQWSANMRDFAKALGESGTEVVGLNGHIDVTTEKGGALQDTVTAQTEAFNQMAVATFEAAQAQGQTLPQAIETTRTKLNQQRQSFIDLAVAGGMSVDAANNLANAYGLIPNEKVLKLDASAIPKATADLEQLGIKTTTLPDGLIKITDTSPENLQHLKDIGVKTETLPDGSVVINLNDDEARRIMDELLKEQTKVIWIDSKPINKQYGSANDVPLGGTHERFGGIQTFANGGHHIDKPMSAGIYKPAADYTIFAEKKTKGETYLPWDEATRDRSLGIMDETAHAWGYQVVPLGVQSFGQGGITPSAVRSAISGLSTGQYVFGGWDGSWDTDCSGAQAKGANFATTGDTEAGGRFATGNQAEALAARGYRPGQAPSGVPAIEHGWYNGGEGGGHTAGLIQDPANGDTPFEMGGNSGDGAVGAGASSSRDIGATDYAWYPLGSEDPNATGSSNLGSQSDISGSSSSGYSGPSYGVNGAEGNSQNVFVTNWPSKIADPKVQNAVASAVFTKYAGGGTVPGYGNEDSEPALLMPEEEVTPKDMARKHRRLLKAIARDDVPRYADGGTVGGFSSGFGGYQDPSVTKVKLTEHTPAYWAEQAYRLGVAGVGGAAMISSAIGPDGSFQGLSTGSNSSPQVEDMLQKLDEFLKKPGASVGVYVGDGGQIIVRDETELVDTQQQAQDAMMRSAVMRTA